MATAAPKLFALSFCSSLPLRLCAVFYYNIMAHPRPAAVAADGCAHNPWRRKRYASIIHTCLFRSNFFLLYTLPLSRNHIAVPILKAKWKGLRDMFRVEIKRIPRSASGETMVEPHEYESKWTHYKSLLFLGKFQWFRFRQDN